MDSNKLNIILKKIDYLYQKEKDRENKQKRKAQAITASGKDIDEIFSYYKLFIQESARESPQAREAIRVFLRGFGREMLIATLEKKSKSKWFMENCGWRGASWFFSNKTRFKRWIEEGIPIQKKRPYFNNQPMTHDCKKVLVDGEWKQYAGDNKLIEWRNV